MQDTFTCEMCNKTYEKGWSEEESTKEMRESWGDLPQEHRSVVCDDCFQKIDPEKNLEVAKKHGYKK